jgi:hypothetical protein
VCALGVQQAGDFQTDTAGSADDGYVFLMEHPGGTFCPKNTRVE